MSRSPHPRGRGPLRGADHHPRTGGELSPPRAALTEAELRARLAPALLDPQVASQIEVAGGTLAAVLAPVFVRDGDLHIVFTRRREHLRRHAGEVSFPGGRRDDGETDFIATALREAHEEIGLDPRSVEVLGALEPTPTIATNYAVYPFVGLIDAQTRWTLSPKEVAAVLELSVADLLAGYDKRRLLRFGIPLRMDTYIVGEDLIWGATARMLGDLLARLAAAGLADPLRPQSEQ